MWNRNPFFIPVIPANAGISNAAKSNIPADAGMTVIPGFSYNACSCENVERESFFYSGHSRECGNLIMGIDKTYYVYILASKKNGVLYIGMTNDLEQRIYQHRSESIPGFTKKYHVKKLVYYELFEKPYDAICREKAMKKWYRKWKVELIETHNPEWRDLVSPDGTIYSIEEARYPLTLV